MRLDTIQQCPSLIGAELDFLEASEQFAALKHGASPPASRGNLRMETWELGVMDSKREVKRAHRKLSDKALRDVSPWCAPPHGRVGSAPPARSDCPCGFCRSPASPHFRRCLGPRRPMPPDGARSQTVPYQCQSPPR